MYEETIETTRLILRAWKDSDAQSLFTFASDPEIGYMAGWKPHTSVEDSAQVIEGILSAPEQYAIVIKNNSPNDMAVGAIGLRLGPNYDNNEDTDECEIGYWIGRPFWGQGYVPEASRALVRHAFEDLDISAIWAGYYEGNEQSMRAAAKVGFVSHHTDEQVKRGELDETVDAHMMLLTKEEWELAQVADPTTSSYVEAQQKEANEHGDTIARIAYVRSGGQSGVDRGALDAARDAGIPICGWVPPGGLAEDTPDPPGLLANYPELIEAVADGYVERTALNVRDAHATLIIAPGGLEPKSGTEMTAKFAEDYARPYLVIDGEQDIEKANAWLNTLGSGLTLNVAGPRESKLPGVYLLTKRIVSALLDEGSESV